MLMQVRLSSGNTDMISKIAICAGSGASVLGGVDADVYLTGEMSHHEVLEAKAAGKHTILCEHTNTERGFLGEILLHKLSTLIGSDITIECSTFDADPLNIV